MISCIVLERPGKWRPAGIAGLFLLVVLPAAPLLGSTLSSPGTLASLLEGGFGTALWNSAVVAVGVATVAFVLGLPLGVVAALYEFPGRRTFLALVTLPLLVPSFLWAIGWSRLAAALGVGTTVLLSGYVGSILVFSAGAIPLVVLMAYTSAAGLSTTQLQAARLAGGEKIVFRYASRHAATTGLLGAALGGVLTLSDSGPGQILGLRTAASEVLTSFAALYDFRLAGQQCVLLTAIILVLAAALAYLAAPRLASEILPRQVLGWQRLRQRRIGHVALAAFGIVLVVGTVAPVVGLTLPLAGGEAGGEALRRAWGDLVRTATNTLLYAVGAGVVATLLGLVLAFLVGHNSRYRTACAGLALALFSLPPALSALGLIHVGNKTPPWADVLFRSRLTPCLALGLRFFPVAALLALRAWGSMSSSWALAAGLHGVSMPRYLRRVVLPFLLPTLLVSMLLVALLATADISTVSLLYPPGESSFPLVIFTVEANAPEALVASLCLIYVVAAGGLLGAMWVLAGRHT